MKKRHWSILNSLLAALVLLLLELHWQVGRAATPAVPVSRPVRTFLTPAAGSGGARQPLPPQPGAPELSAASIAPGEIANALGWLAPPAPAPAAPAVPQRPAPATEPAPWVHFLGTIIESDGTAYRYFKDEHSGRIIRAAEGIDVDGRRLTRRSDGSFLLSGEGKTLLVRIDQ